MRSHFWTWVPRPPVVIDANAMGGDTGDQLLVIDRLACTAEEFGITVDVRPEAWTS